MSENIFITTPIYYINDKPHIGHTYSTFTADILAKFYRSLGKEVFFSTGTDENSQKTIEAAKKLYLENSENGEKLKNFVINKGYENLLNNYLSNPDKEIPLELVKLYTDYMAGIWKQTWENLQISFNDFIRTTEKRHINAVIKFYQKAKQNGFIYKGKYKGLYCWKCEAFYKEEELLKENGKLLCPTHKTEVEQIEEENYFFKLTNFKDKLKTYFSENHIFPDFRKKEMENNFLNELEDFSISREGKKWGIKFPDDPNHVFYVWYDALTNYLSVLDYANDGKLFDKFWNNGKIIHIIGKDILKFHSIYWPAMLWAAEEKKPNLIVSHGFFTINGEKISKSLGNAINPLDLIKQFDIDSIRYYLFKDLKFGNDGDFSFERLKDLHNSNLVGGWGNLVSRIINMAIKNNINSIQNNEIKIIKHNINEFLSKSNELSQENNLIKLIINNFEEKILLKYFENFDFQGYLNHWYELVQFTNKYIDYLKPWETCKQDENKCKTQLKTLLYLIRKIAILSSLFLINGFKKFKHATKDPSLDQINLIKKTENIAKIFDLNNITFNLEKVYLYKKIN